MLRWSIYPVASGLIVILAVGCVLSTVYGAMELPPVQSIYLLIDQVSGSQLSQLSDYEKVVVLELRLPRLMLALLVGAVLAQCGTVMQGLFRNPLADPGIIGVSSGAAVGAIIAIVWLQDWGAWIVPSSAVVSGLLTTLLVYGLAQSRQGTSILILLLAGVAIAAFANAIIGFISYFANDEKLRQLSLWQMGSLTGAGQAQLWIPTVVMVGLVVYFQRQATALNAMLLGECEARHMGINVETLKLQLIMTTALGVGVAVAFSGIIGFVGLVVPHLVRLTTGPNHHTLLPLSALLGALLMLIADLLARTIVQPAELPVGLVTALLGAPFFLVLLLQQRQHQG